MKLGDNIIAASGLAPFFRVANPAVIGLDAPEPRLGEALRTSVRALSGFQKEALVTSARTGATWRLVSDEGPYLNGHDAAPCPLAFLTAGMIAANMNAIMGLAAHRKLAIRRLRLTQDNVYTMRGSMPKRTMVGGAPPVELGVEIDCDLDDRELTAFLAQAVRASPLDGLLRDRHASRFALARNGASLEPAKVAPLNEAILPDPGPLFARARPAPGVGALVEPIGLTAAKAVPGGTSAGGSSLAADQDRRLDIGAVCTLRPDGLKEIVALQYSPHGTSFRMLSEEAPANGGQGRAPDALSYASAGIGFCFMTQFGRFVSMLRLDLPDYSIVQDTHFSAARDPAAQGEAGPVETHVHLTTTESADVAREMLDIAEQTCFLHALCRTALDTEIAVVRL